LLPKKPDDDDEPLPDDDDEPLFPKVPDDDEPLLPKRPDDDEPPMEPDDTLALLMDLVTVLDDKESAEVEKLMQDPVIASSPNKLLANISEMLELGTPTTPSPLCARALKFSSGESIASGGSSCYGDGAKLPSDDIDGKHDVAVPGLRGPKPECILPKPEYS